MSNCILCDTEISFKNRPAFNQGKLKDGNELCSSCYLKSMKDGNGIQRVYKKMTANELKESLAESDLAKEIGSHRLIEIKEQVKKANLDRASSFLGYKEVNELPKILFNHESVLGIVQGVFEKRQGILVATEGRVIFIDKGFLYGLKVEDFSYNKISSIQFETGLLFGKIIIVSSGNNALIDQIIKNQVKPFTDLVREKISEISNKSSMTAQPTTITPQFDLAVEITKFADLRDKGILTEEEFQKKKLQLLEQ